MNILHLSHRIPYPPNKGDKVRSYHEIEHLSRRHDVWCACFVDDPADAKYVGALRSLCRAVIAVPLHPKWAALRGLARLAVGGALSEGYYWDHRMADALRTWGEVVDFDAVLLYSSSMAPYADGVRARRKVIDFTDWDSVKWNSYAKYFGGPKGWVCRLEARRLRQRETRWLHAFDASTVITRAEADRAPVNGAGGRKRLHVVGNGVVLPGDPADYPTGRPPRIGFVGQMDYTPNVDAVRWFVGEVFPRIRACVSDATFEIVGRAPSRRVLALARQPGVRVVGAVDDVRPHLNGFAVSVAPLRLGQGIQNKVLEAMASARPVVLTSVAAEGIEAVDGQHFVVADGGAGMADAVVQILREPGRAAAIGAAARSFVADQFSWDRQMAKMEAILLNAGAGT